MNGLLVAPLSRAAVVRVSRPAQVAPSDPVSPTSGVVRCDQPRVLDLPASHARKVDSLPAQIMDEVLAKVATLFE